MSYNHKRITSQRTGVLVIGVPTEIHEKAKTVVFITEKLFDKFTDEPLGEVRRRARSYPAIPISRARFEEISSNPNHPYHTKVSHLVELDGKGRILDEIYQLTIK